MTMRTQWLTMLLGLSTFLACSTSAVGAVSLTHGPVAGHTTDRSTRIWVRANGAANLQLQMLSPNGRPVHSAKVMLKRENNYCATAVIENLTPATTYRYTVYLNGMPQPARFEQYVKTFAPTNQPGQVRIGFGHSIRGSGKQTTWSAIDSKKPDLFILMGDNVYSNTTEPAAHRRAYLMARSDPCFCAFAAHTPIYAIWDDHDYGKDNSDRTQPGRERSLKTFREIWPNPPSLAQGQGGIWTRFSIAHVDIFLLDVRYHRSPDDAPDGPDKTMLGTQQRQWLLQSLSESKATFKFLVSGSSWNCGGVESWNHRYVHEYDLILDAVRRQHVSGVILLGGDQHECKIGVRPAETWGGYDLHEWMAGQVWNYARRQAHRGFGLVTIDTTVQPARAKVEFFDQHGAPRKGKRILYTPPGALRALWDSPPDSRADVPRAADGELRSDTNPLWDAMPSTTGEVLTTAHLRFSED